MKISLTSAKKQSPKSKKYRVLGWINSRKNILKHIIIKLTKIKEKEKIATKNQKNCSQRKATSNIQGNSHKIISWFLSRNCRPDGCGMTYLKWWKNLQPKISYPTMLSFRFDRQINSLIDKQKLRGFSTTRPAFQQMLNKLLQVGKKRLYLETRKLWMEKLTSKGKHTKKVGNNIHTNMIPKSMIKPNNQNGKHCFFCLLI